MRVGSPRRRRLRAPFGERLPKAWSLSRSRALARRDPAGGARFPGIQGISIKRAREAARLVAMFQTLGRGAFIRALKIAGLAIVLGAGGASGERIISLNPSLTAILVALGAGDSIVGVDDYSAEQIPAVAGLPRVGGLFSPSLEAVVTLRPDRVVLVPSSEQRNFRGRLEALGVPVTGFSNIRFEEVLSNIRQLGRLVGREAQAEARIEAIERARDAARQLAERKTSPRVLVVLQRDPVYVVGGGNFIQEMLETLGARNPAAEFSDPYPRVAAEWVVANAPDVLIDLSPDRAEAVNHWSRWPSLPAVATGRVVALEAELISMPGPGLDRAFEALAKGLYGESAGPGEVGLPAGLVSDASGPPRPRHRGDPEGRQ